MRNQAPTLPGLGPVHEGYAAGEIETSTCAAFDDLEAHGLLGPTEKIKRAALLKAARALDVGLTAPRVSVSTSTVLSRFLDELDALPKTVTGADAEMDAFEAAVRGLTVAAFESTSSAA